MFPPRLLYRIPSLFLSLLLLFGTMATARAQASLPLAQESTGTVSAAKDEKDVPVLEQGKPLERELKGGESHFYKINLSAGQFVHVVVEQKGIDAVVFLCDPDGKKLAEFLSPFGPNGKQGPRSFSLLAEADKSYQIEARSVEPDAPTGLYRAKIEELRQATQQDRDRIAAQKLFVEGMELSAQGAIESRQKAIEKYKESLPLWRASGDRIWEANTLNYIGNTYDSLGEKQKGLDYNNQSLALSRSERYRPGEANALFRIGLAYRDLGELQKTLDYFNQALLIWRALEYRREEAFTLTHIGLAYRLKSEPRKALDYFNRALPLERAGNDRKGEATTLIGIGNAYVSLGDEQQAIDYYNQALPLQRATKDRLGEAYSIVNIGQTYISLGEQQKALDHLKQALPLLRTLFDSRGEAYALTTIGIVYTILGENKEALDYYNQALPLHRAVGNRYGEAYALYSMGNSYHYLGDEQKALDYYNQALSIRKAIGDRDGEAFTLTYIGASYTSLGEQRKALDYFNEALPIYREVGDRNGEAFLLDSLGEAYESLNEKQKALDCYNQALSLEEMFGYSKLKVTTLYGSARVERSLNNLTEARKKIEAALRIAESLRTKVASQDLRASYSTIAQDYYEFYIDLLMQLHRLNPLQGEDGVALQASERARARSLLDLLSESQANIRQGIDPQLLERERTLQQKLNSKAELLIKLRPGKSSQEQTETVERELRALTTEFRDLEAEIKAKSPRYAALTQPEPLSLKEIQEQVLDADTLLLEYALGNERSYLWAVAPTSIASYELPKREEIEATALRVYELLTAREKREFETDEELLKRVKKADAEYQEAAAGLSRMLLDPVARQLGNKRLLIVAEGVLQYVPFGALPVPKESEVGSRRSEVRNQRNRSKQALASRPPTSDFLLPTPLIVEHEIVNLPSASTLAVLRRELAGRKPADNSVAIFANPVFSDGDERVKTATTKAKEKPDSAKTNSIDTMLAGLQPLPETEQMAKDILALVPAEKSKLATGFNANLVAATSPALSRYRVIHYATHGFLNQNPELSGIVLSLVNEEGREQSGFLSAPAIFNLELPVDLVVLSACQTGLALDPRESEGKRTLQEQLKKVKSQGLVGLTRGFMYAGAERVVVSLWKIRVRATSEMMVRFYSRMLGRQKLSPAAALRAAQVEMWKQARWRSPYYWAAFVISGEYR